MPTEIKLRDGASIRSNEDPQALVERFDIARRDGKLTKVDQGDDAVWINPHAVTTIRKAASRELHSF